MELGHARSSASLEHGDARSLGMHGVRPSWVAMERTYPRPLLLPTRSSAMHVLSNVGVTVPNLFLLVTILRPIPPRLPPVISSALGSRPIVVAVVWLRHSGREDEEVISTAGMIGSVHTQFRMRVWRNL
ncbi:hypothetical protein Dimus_029169 [Dionaea muscipula]